MRVLAALLFSSAVVLAPAIAAAQATTTPTAPASAAASSTSVATTDSSAVNLDEIVCKNEPPATGTRLGGGRECHTVREWNQRQRDSQDLTRHQEITGFKVPGG